MSDSKNNWNKSWLLIIFIIPLVLTLGIPLFSSSRSINPTMFVILLHGFIRFAAGLFIYLIIFYLVRELIKHFRDRA